MKEATKEEWTEFFKSQAQSQLKLEPLKACAIPCRECVAEDMYLEFACHLKEQPKELQDKVLEGWFCHMTGNRCVGVRDFIQH